MKIKDAFVNVFLVLLTGISISTGIFLLKNFVDIVYWLINLVA